MKQRGAGVRDHDMPVVGCEAQTMGIIGVTQDSGRFRMRTQRRRGLEHLDFAGAVVAYGDPLAVVAVCDAIGDIQAAPQKHLVPAHAIIGPRDHDVPGDPVGIIVADEQTDPAVRLMPGGDRTRRFQPAEDAARNFTNSTNPAVTAGEFAGRQLDYRDKSVAIGDRQGPVVDEIEAMHASDAVRSQLHEVVGHDLRPRPGELDVDPQDKAMISTKGRNNLNAEFAISRGSAEP